MCKYCELENKEYLIDNDTEMAYIMNNIGIPAQLVFSTGERGRFSYLKISYCPICGTRLVDYENLHKEGY